MRSLSKPERAFVAVGGKNHKGYAEKPTLFSYFFLAYFDLYTSYLLGSFVYVVYLTYCVLGSGENTISALPLIYML